MGLLLEMAFLTLDIALGIHGFRSPRYLESGRNHFLESTFLSYFEEEYYKNCSIFLRSHLRRSQRNASYCFWYKARLVDTIAFLNLLTEFSPPKWMVYLGLEYIRPHILARKQK